MSKFGHSRRKTTKSIRTFFVDISDTPKQTEKPIQECPVGIKPRAMHTKCASGPLLSETHLSVSISVSRFSKARKLSQFSGNYLIDLSKPRSSQSIVAKKESAEYEKYLESTLKALQSCQEILSIGMLEIVPKQVALPDVHDKKTVIFDLDETLVHAVQGTRSEKQIDLVLPNGELSQIGIQFRPFVQQCLRETSQLFEVIVFTASDKAYADAVLNYLDPMNQMIHHRLYREHCVQVKYGMVKDLRIFINRDIKDLILVDNSCLSFASQIENGVPIRSWFGDPKDQELLKLIAYLKEMKNQRDVRDLNRKKFRLCTFDERQISLKFN